MVRAIVWIEAETLLSSGYRVTLFPADRIDIDRMGIAEVYLY